MGVLYLHTYLRELPQGLDRAEESVQMWNELGRPDMVAATINAAARVQLETGSAEAAEGWYDRAWQAIQGSSMKPAERTIWQVRCYTARRAALRRSARWSAPTDTPTRRGR